MNKQLKPSQVFQSQRRLRSWRNVHFGGMEAVKAHPLSICRFRPDEGGTVSTNLNLNLAPVDGHMRSKAYVDVYQIFVPYQAIEVLEMDGTPDAGVTEMTRRRLMEGNGVGLEEEGPVTKAANIHGRSVAGTNKVTKSARLAYIAAVNHLRKVAYYGAAVFDKTETAILPAVLAANVLKRFNGVLEPETLVDGAINLTGDLPVKGIGIRGNPFSGGQQTDIKETGEEGNTTYDETTGATNNNVRLEEDPDNPGYPRIVATLDDAASNITLRDMMESRKLDSIVRSFAKMVQENPIYGEEMVERAIYGLSVDFDDQCHVMYQRTFTLQPEHMRPTDGASFNDVSAHFAMDESFATLVPRSELGGQLVTLAMVRPLETLSAQPDPAQTEAWELVNRIHDETQLEEQLLTRADLESGVAAEDADTPAFWVGHNGLKHDYQTQGANAQQTFEVEMKSSMWTYEIPTSVTPANIAYPDAGVDMYPFYNWNGAHAEYTIQQVAAISTQLAKGPNPVEKIQLLADDPALVNDD